MSSVRILFLVGSGRSGTTLLSRILDREAGYRAVGETRYLALPERWGASCGCGAAHEDCPVWGPHIARWSEPGRREAWQDIVFARQNDQIRTFALPSRPPQALRRGAPVLRELFEGLGSTGEVVVDESKTPWIGYVLAQQPWADVRFVELVRNPRAVIASWQNAKDYLDRTPRETAALHWLRTCVTADAIRRRARRPWIRLPYTQLAEAPGETVTQLVGRPPTGLHEDDGRQYFESAENHIYLSNPDKLRRGREFLRPPGTAPELSSDAGWWERRASAYWERWLASRTFLDSAWRAF